MNAPMEFELFGDYVLLKELSSGGMAEVFLARPAKTSANGRVLVIKRIRSHIATDPVFIDLFRSEIRMTLGFNHPHTIQLHDFGEVDGHPYIAMEYIEGKSLREIAEKFREKNESIPVPTVLGLISQAAAGLNYAHHFENLTTGENVHAIHCDVSPHNLIVSYGGNLKVIDFGIAKAKNGMGPGAHRVQGKTGYLSTEQLANQVIDARSDVFSLGVVAWELLTGVRLFRRDGDSEIETLRRIRQCEEHTVAPSTLNFEVPSEVDAVILTALQKNREDRYPSAAAFQNALCKVLRRLYPTHTYADTADLLRVLFAGEIVEDRTQLRSLNHAAQTALLEEISKAESSLRTAAEAPLQLRRVV